MEKTKAAAYLGSLLLSSVLISIPFFFPNLFILSWFGFIPWIFAIRKRTPGSSFLFSLLVGVLFFTMTTYWITTTITQYGNLHISIALFLNILLSTYLALYLGLFGLIFALIRKIFGINMALIFAPSLWIISEWLRGHIFTGFPWNLAAYSQYLFLPIVQIGEFFGPYGLSWLIVAFNSAVVYLIVNRKKDAGLRKFIYPTAILVLFMVSLIYGTLCIDSYSKDSNLKVVLIQGDAGMENWTFDDYNKNLQKHSDMIMQSGREGKGLAILSETSLRGFGFHPGSSFAGWMRRVSINSGMDVLFGSATSTLQYSEDKKYYNSAVLLLPNKEIPQIYSKVHLVPFGEYIPFKKILFFVDKFSKGIIGDFSAGEKYEILTLSDGHRFGTGICYELLFPELMRQFTINGAEFLANITNDTWYGKTVMPYHHFSLSVFRAVENRKYVVRAANSGFSGITAPDGRIIEKSGLYTDTIISSYIHPNRVVTIYAKFGDWFIYLNALTLIVCIASINWKKRRQKEK